MLGRADVHLGVGEIGEAAGVIEIEVREDDVAHVARGEAERLELRQRRLRGLAARPRHRRRRSGRARSSGVGDVARAEPGVDEDEAVARSR